MAGVFEIDKMLSALYNAMISVSAHVFPQEDRPESVTAEMKDFILVYLPVTIENTIHGMDGGQLRTTCRIDIYVRDNSKGENIPREKALLNDAIDKFPIVTDTVTISTPKVVMNGSDNHGFHVATILAKLKTK